MNSSILKVRIESLSYNGGRGVGRHNGEVIFVPFTAPGDLVEIKIIERKKRFAVGQVISVIESGASRTLPQCPVFGVCGGCDWQHVDYQEQLNQKDKILRRTFQKLNPTFKNFLPSPLTYRYRNRIQLHFKNGRMGFFARSSHKLVEIEDCPITELAVTNQMKNIDRSTERKEISVTDSNNQTFSQVNTEQNKNLITAVLAAISPDSKKILDLYCGHGNFTFPIAQHLPLSEVTGVELSKSSIQLAQQLAHAQSHIKFVCENVETYLESNRTLCDTILLDPPRAGITPNVIKGLLNQKNVETLIYVSCQPMTLVRDLEPLMQDFVITSVQGFDMFPQTAHIETLCVMQRRN